MVVGREEPRDIIEVLSDGCLVGRVDLRHDQHGLSLRLVVSARRHSLNLGRRSNQR